MVAQQGDQLAFAAEPQQPVDHPAAVRAAVDVVAQQDDRVVRPRLDCRQQGFQRGQAAVDVADGNSAGMGKSVSLPSGRVRTLRVRTIPYWGSPECADYISDENHYNGPHGVT